METENETQDEIEALQARIETLLQRIAELEHRLNSHKSDDFNEFLFWCRQRERLVPNDDLFYVFEESYIKAKVMLEPLQNYIDSRIWNQVLFSLGLHYIITTEYTYTDEEGEEQKNPLFEKFDIASRSYIISSASDEGSSSSIHATKSLNDGDFVMQDLIRTKYGMYVYSILEQLDIGAVLL